MLGQPSANSTCLLGAEIEREVLLILVKLANVLSLFLVRDSKNASNRFTDSVDSREFRC